MTNVKRNLTVVGNLKWLRTSHGYTLKYMSEMLGISANTLGSYECDGGIGKERLNLFCIFWGVDVEHLEMEPEAFQAWYRFHISMYGEAASWCKGV